MSKRRAERTRKRLACGIEMDDGRASGMILDISAVGFFIQTSATLDPGDNIALEFAQSGNPELLRVQCRVVRRRSVPVRLQAVMQAGVGVEVVQAPEAFYVMIASLQEVGAGSATRKPTAAEPPARPTRKRTPARSVTPPEPKAEAEDKPPSRLAALRKHYRVEVHEVGGKGARIVEVEALNAAAAGRKALVEVGDGWKVVGCEVA